ncbi:hypothetical protein C5167_001924 [Papaver somniferum]|uniref:Fe2OG dioxygenase domain-containing protein n=1 Tax=Papaver somniferum TaxID=3469 RepID=A0A4Y7L0A4_PAPSO|nr:hypothetical protein C5167_001924 [Papaver somniferum]
METLKQINLGGFVQVLGVQEMAKQMLTEIPPRYIANLLSAEPELELERLHFACKEWGFFQVVNHGVDNILLESDKEKYEGGDEGFGQQFVLSEEQKLDWGDLFYMVTRPLYLRKPHLFLNSLYLSGRQLNPTCQKMNYYPPCPQPDLVMGVTPHSDFGGLTILLQLNEVEGLQIRNKGEWVTVKPLHNAFIANIGDVMEILTNGLYHSVEHRGRINSTKERLSVATFHYPKLDSEIGPLPSIVA